MKFLTTTHHGDIVRRAATARLFSRKRAWEEDLPGWQATERDQSMRVVHTVPRIKHGAEGRLSLSGCRISWRYYAGHKLMSDSPRTCCLHTRSPDLLRSPNLSIHTVWARGQIDQVFLTTTVISLASAVCRSYEYLNS